MIFWSHPRLLIFPRYMDTDTMANKRLRNIMHVTMSTITDMAMGTKWHIATDTMILIAHSGWGNSPTLPSNRLSDGWPTTISAEDFLWSRRSLIAFQTSLALLILELLTPYLSFIIIWSFAGKLIIDSTLTKDRYSNHIYALHITVWRMMRLDKQHWLNSWLRRNVLYAQVKL